MTVADEIFQRSNVLIVQQPVMGADYRVVILNGEVISAYKRIPLQVSGNGTSSIDELLLQAKRDLHKSGRPNSEIDLDDFRIDQKLSESGLSRSSVVAANDMIVLLDNANLSNGGCSEDITSSIHPEFSEIARQATEAIGLKLCGVHIITADLTASASGQAWAIIELNAAPGLDNYVAIGEVQMERVENLYRKILLSLAQG